MGGFLNSVVLTGAMVASALLTYRLIQCQTALQWAGEVVRALGVAVLVALSSLLGRFSAWAPLYTWFDQQGLPMRVVIASVLGVSVIAIPARLLRLGTGLYWRGSWTFSRPRPANTTRSWPAGILLWSAGWACRVAGVAGTLWGYGNILATLPHFPAVAHYAWFGAGIAAVPASQLILNRARRHLAPVLSSVADLAAGSYVLYLRPFSIDDHRAAIRPAVVEMSAGAASLFEVLLTTGSDEQQIATTLRPAGTVVAVGAPGESLPYKGALRMYLAQDWQPTVARLIRNARLVVVTLASSEGTMWELAEAMRTMPPQRLLLMVPPMKPDEYEAIRARNAEELHGPVRNPTWNGQRVPALPDSDEAVSGPSGLIRFSEQWQPTFVRLPRRDPVSSGYGWSLSYDLRRGLRPAFDALSSYERSTATRSGNA